MASTSEGERTIVCKLCQKPFRDLRDLKRHEGRKTPCAPIVEKVPSAVRSNACKYCGRTFASATSMSRHVRQNCKIANTDEGMDLLMCRTLEQQRGAALEAKVDRLAELVEKLAVATTSAAGLGAALTVSPATPPPSVSSITNYNADTINTGPVTNVMNHVTNVTQINTVVNIKNFDGDDRIRISPALIDAAFTQNPRLMEYVRMSDAERTDVDKSAPYVLETLIDLIRRAHKDPIYRNVYLNPKRSDQAMVWATTEETERWEVRTFLDVIRALFDGVAHNMQHIFLSEKQRALIPMDVQCAASWVPSLYESEPERFVRDGKSPMAAHLQNTGPPT